MARINLRTITRVPAILNDLNELIEDINVGFDAELDATLNENQVYIGNSSNAPVGVAIQGDASLISDGTLTVSNVEISAINATGTADNTTFLRGDGQWVVSGGGDLLSTNNLSDVADASTSRTNLGVAIGVDVQAYDANTAFTDVAQTYTAQQNFSEATLSAAAASIAWNLETQQAAVVTLGANGPYTLANPTNLVAGGTYMLRVIQDGTGSRTLAYGSAYQFPGGTAPTLSTDPNAIDLLTFTSDGTNMFGVFQGDFS